MHLKSLVGADISSVGNIEEDFEWAKSLGYGFILANLYDKKESKFISKEDTRIDPVNGLNYLQITNSTVINGVVGKTSSWIDLDNSCESFRKTSEKALIEELEYAIFQGVPAVIINLTKRNNANLARILSTFIDQQHFYYRIWIKVPMSDESEFKLDGEDPEDTWLWWNEFSSMMGDFLTPHISLMLTLPQKSLDDWMINKWFSEPIAAIEIPTVTFLTNRGGYPVLSMPLQDVILKFFTLKIQIVISGEVKNPRGYLAYFQYIAHLWKNKPQLSIYDKNSKDMEDHLQDPLQPLADHLPSLTYSIFELDPYKYSAYEEAIYKALCDFVESDALISDFKDEFKEIIIEDPVDNSATKSYAEIMKNGTTGINGSDNNGKLGYINKEKYILMVLGAGRGPLVDCAIKAADRANCDITIYVVEKNPNAVVYLRNKLLKEWINRDIILCPGDMRHIKMPYLAHIFISELLGSFGDNELSPECLDGAQQFLRPDNGISIPASYTSYIAPIQSTKLFHEMSNQQNNRTKAINNYAGLETPYVVNLKNFTRLTEVEEVFTFEHPKKDVETNNNRYKSITFDLPKNCVIHGFVGYFHSVLYKDVTMSIHPQKHSPDMFSWFPILFPISRPLAASNESIEFHIWRLANSKSVWYEWTVTGNHSCNLPIHNPGGRSYSMSLLSK